MMDVLIFSAIYIVVVSVLLGYLDLRQRRRIAVAKKIARRALIVGMRIENDKQRMAYMAKSIRDGRIKSI